MIDVPVLVKDALRDGRRLKNYRFMVQNKVTTRNISYIMTYTPETPTFTVVRSVMLYMHVAAYQPTGSMTFVINFPGGGSMSKTISHTYGTEYFDMFGGYEPGTVISFIPLPGVSYIEVGLTAEDLIRYTTTWVDDFEIDNNTLITESVNIDEAMCSDKMLKFGLCEGSSLEFQYFDHPSIKDKRIRASVDVQYENSGTLSWYNIPMGYYIVDSCPRQASTGIYKVTAYNKLKSDYLDAKANDLLDTLQTDTDNELYMSVWAIQKELLNDYEIEEKDGSPGIPLGQDNTLSFIADGFTFKFNGSSTTYYPIFGYKERGFFIPEGKKLKVTALNKFIRKLQDQQDQLWAGIRSQCQNAETVIENIKSNTAFQMISGVAVGFYNYSGPVPNPHYELTPTLIQNYSSTVSADRALVTNVYSLTELTDVSNQLTVRGKLKNALYFMDAHYIDFFYITQFGGSKSSSTFVDNRYAFDEEDIVFEDDDFEDAYYSPTESEQILIPINDIGDITLRDLVSANYEMNCQFGRLDRVTDLFYGVELLTDALYPAETLYPDDSLYPGGYRESSFRSQYSQLWADTLGAQTFRDLIITYKTLDQDNKEIEAKLTVRVNADGTNDYVMDDNWLFKNLVWTEEQVEEYADAMAAKMQGIRWFPFEMWAAGLPYIETGDAIEIILGQDTHTSYILRRILKGIQNLQDTYIDGTLEIF